LLLLEQPPNGVVVTKTTKPIAKIFMSSLTQERKADKPALLRWLPQRKMSDHTPAVNRRGRWWKVAKTWNAGCGSDRPRGLAYDQARQLLFVACTDKIEVLDAGHDGAVLAQLDTGAGVDSIDVSVRQSASG
jgi:hypothetical protein